MKVIAYTSAARRQLRKLPDGARSSLEAALGRFAATGAGDVRRLIGEPGARLRVGDYRIVFIETPSQIEVRAVGHRRDVYR